MTFQSQRVLETDYSQAIRRSTAKPLNVHLMIAEPERYIDTFARAGADHLLVAGSAIFGAKDYAGAIAAIRVQATAAAAQA
jgi:pentose-5-phosphate-3-epimerase